MTTRREFLKTCACVGAVGALNSFGVGCGGDDSGPMAPNPTGTFDVNLADHPELGPDNRATVISGTAAGSIFLTHTTGATYFALSRICTHQGCTVNPPGGTPTILPCPCHGSQYHLDGSVAQGPAPRALQSWPVTQNGTILTIHFS